MQFFFTILTSKPLSRAGVVQILPHLGQQILRTRPFLGADFPSQRSHKTVEKTQHFAHFLPAKSSCLTSLLYHICAITSLGFKIFSSNSQYSRKTFVGFPHGSQDFHVHEVDLEGVSS